MTVTVDRVPIAPKLTGDYSTDVHALYKYCRALSRSVEQIRERTGGTIDAVATAAETASTASATADAGQAGAVIPTDGGAVTLTPSNPLSYTAIDDTTATIAVAGHMRTGAGAALIAANVSPDVARGETYYVYYSDAGNVGGAQTFLANTSLSVVTGTAGYRIIGTIVVAAQTFKDRDLR